MGSEQGHGVGQDRVTMSLQGCEEPAVLLAEGTAWGEPQRLCGVPGVLDWGCQEGPDKHLASVYL